MASPEQLLSQPGLRNDAMGEAPQLGGAMSSRSEWQALPGTPGVPTVQRPMNEHLMETPITTELGVTAESLLLLQSGPVTASVENANPGPETAMVHSNAEDFWTALSLKLHSIDLWPEPPLMDSATASPGCATPVESPSKPHLTPESPSGMPLLHPGEQGNWGTGEGGLSRTRKRRLRDCYTEGTDDGVPKTTGIPASLVMSVIQALYYHEN